MAHVRHPKKKGKKWIVVVVLYPEFPEVEQHEFDKKIEAELFYNNIKDKPLI